MRNHPAVVSWVQISAVVLFAWVAGACSSRSAASDWNVQGPIQAIDGRVWVVGDQLVTLAPDARIVGSPALGSVAQVRGTRDERGSPIAESVEIAPLPQATAQPTATVANPTLAPAAPQPAPAAPPPAPAVKPIPPSKPQAEREADEKDDKKDDKKDDEEKRRGPPPNRGNSGNGAEKPRGR